MEFKVTDCVIDLRNNKSSIFGITLPSNPSYGYPTLYTSLGILNSAEVNYISNCKSDSINVILETDFVDNITNAIRVFKRVYSEDLIRNTNIEIESLIISSDCNVTTEIAKEILDLLKSKIIKSIGIKIEPNATSMTIPENVEKIITTIGADSISYISAMISPLYFNANVQKLVEKYKFEMIGYNPFGDKLSESAVINSFTKDYLLKFISFYSDTVVLSDLHHIRYIEDNVMFKEVDATKYELKRSFNKLVKPLKKAIWDYIVISDDFIIEKTGDYIYLGEEKLKFTLGEIEEKIPDLPKEMHPCEIEVCDYLSNIRLPKDSNNLKVLMLFAFAAVIKSLSKQGYNEIRYSIKADGLIRLTCSSFETKTPKFYEFWKSKETICNSDSFVLAISKNKKIVFRKI